jgi:hypothetical protein
VPACAVQRLSGRRRLCPGGIALLRQAVRIGEIRQRHLPQLNRLAVGVLGFDHTGGIDVDAAERAGGLAVLLDRIDGKRIAELGGLAEIEIHVQRAGAGGRRVGTEVDGTAGRRGQGAIGGEGQRLRSTHGLTVDREVGVPLVGGGGLGEIDRRGMGGAERIVHRRGGGIIVAVGIGGVERSIGRHRGIGRQVERHVDVLGRHRRAVGSGQLQSGGGAGVEAAVGGRCIHLQHLALRIDHVAVGVGREITGARIRERAAVADGEESLAAERQVQVVAGGFDRALREILRHGRDLHAVADGIGSDAVLRAGIEIGKFRHGLLETRGIRIGDVVGHDVQIGLRGVDAGQSDAK